MMFLARKFYTQPRVAWAMDDINYQRKFKMAQCIKPIFIDIDDCVYFVYFGHFVYFVHFLHFVLFMHFVDFVHFVYFVLFMHFVNFVHFVHIVYFGYKVWTQKNCVQ